MPQVGGSCLMLAIWSRNWIKLCFPDFAPHLLGNTTSDSRCVHGAYSWPAWGFMCETVFLSRKPVQYFKLTTPEKWHFLKRQLPAPADEEVVQLQFFYFIYFINPWRGNCVLHIWAIPWVSSGIIKVFDSTGPRVDTLPRGHGAGAQNEHHKATQIPTLGLQYFLRYFGLNIWLPADV